MTFSPSNVARRARATCVWRQRRGLSTVRKSVSQNHRRVASVARVRTLNPLVARLLRRRLSARARAALSPVIARSEARGRRAIAHSVSNDAFRARSLRRHRATLLQRWFRPRPQNFDLVSAEISLAPRRPIARVAPRRIEKPRTARVFTAPLALDRRRAPNRAAARGRARESTERGGSFEVHDSCGGFQDFRPDAKIPGSVSKCRGERWTGRNPTGAVRNVYARLVSRGSTVQPYTAS